MFKPDDIEFIESLVDFYDLEQNAAMQAATLYRISRIIDDVFAHLMLHCPIADVLSKRNGIAYIRALRGIQNASEDLMILSHDIQPR